jgi:hypothetical protein
MTETAREAFKRELERNPRWQEAPRTGQVTATGGGRPTADDGAQSERSQAQRG